MDEIDIILLSILSIVIITNICCKLFNRIDYSLEPSESDNDAKSDKDADEPTTTPKNFIGGRTNDNNFDYLSNKLLSQKLKDFHDTLSEFNAKTSDENTTNFEKACNNPEILNIGKKMKSKLESVMDELKKEHSDKIDFAKAGSLIKGLLNK